MLLGGMAYGPAALGVRTGEPPPDRVMAVRGASDFARFQERLTPCVEHARTTFPEARQRFVAGLEPGHDLFVVIRVRDPQAHVEQVFVQVQTIDGPLISGVISNEVVAVKGFEQGTPVLTFHDEILDWVIVDSTGAETGNFIGKYLDALQEGTVEGPCEPAD